MKKSVIGILVGLTMVASLIIVFFWGQVHIGEEGCLIVTKTPEHRMNQDTGKYCYYYDMIINWDRVTVIVEGPKAPVQLVSDKLGSLEIDILGDLEEWTNTIKKSEYLEAVEESAYSIDQIDLLYEYFVYSYDDERKSFEVADYSMGSDHIHLVAVAMAIVVELCWKMRKANRDGSEYTEKLILCLVNLALVGYLVVMSKVTFWGR